MEKPSRAASLTAVAALGDPVRRALYEFVSARDAPVGRDEAANSLALSRSTAAFHLDRLAQEGLLEVEFRRIGGKTGPGSGRPAKLYSRTPSEIAVTLPERHYELAGDVLASAIEQADETGEPVRLAVRRVAGEAGRAAGASASSFEDALEINGFEPRTEQSGDIVLGNCPFHQLARRHTQIVCDLNLELIRGVAEGAGDQRHSIMQDPDAGRCCVRAVPLSASPQGASPRGTPTRQQKRHTDGTQLRSS